MSSPARDTPFWHGQAHMPTVRQHERVIVRGEGAYVWDEEDRKLFDAPASLWYCNIGHGRAEIAEAVHEQMVTLEAYSTFQMYANKPALALSERLVDMSPIPESKVFLTSGGGDAIDCAAKLSRRFWNAEGRPEKRILVTRDRSYHGLHGFGTSIGGLDFNREGYGALMPDTERIPANSLEALEATLEEKGDQVAAFFCEPVIGTGGVIYPLPGFLEGVQRLCREHDVLFVADEVITGFGRTGHMFASQRFGIEPDMITFAKGVTSGYLPLGGVLIGRRLWEPFWAEGSELIFRHGLTYAGHPCACAAGMANLDVIDREHLVDRVASLEPELTEALKPLVGLPGVVDVRSGIGLLAAVELKSAELLAAVEPRTYENGLLTRPLPPSTLQISPPFVSTREDFSMMVEVLRAALEEEAGR